MAVTASARAPLVVVRLLIGAALVAPFWFWKGGVLELEVLHFIQRYLDDRSLLRKVFDPYTNDFRTYQAREFSYFLDYLDAHIFKQLMALDMVVFVPATAVVASVLTIWFFHRGTRRLTGLPPITASLLLLLYLSNFVFLSTVGMFYRSTKPLLAPVLMATTFLVARMLAAGPQTDRGGSWPQRAWHSMLVFGAFCLMSLLDRQGYFYAIVGTGLLLGQSLLTRRHWPLVAAGVAALALVTTYDLVIGPAIVRAVNDYEPSRAFQSVARDPLLTTMPYAHAAELIGKALSALLGSTWTWLAVASLAALCITALRRPPAAPYAAVAVGIVALSQVVMFAVMVVRHPPLYDWIDHHYWYYQLPLQALVVALVAVLLNRALAGSARTKILFVNAALAVAIVSNVAHWGQYRDTMLTSRWFSRVHPQTALLRQSIATGQPDPGLILQYREFYEFCVTLSPGLRERAGRGR